MLYVLIECFFFFFFTSNNTTYYLTFLEVKIPFFKKCFIVIQLQLSAFSPHPSTPPQPNPPPSPTSTLPLDFVHVSFIVQWFSFNYTVRREDSQHNLRLQSKQGRKDFLYLQGFPDIPGIPHPVLHREQSTHNLLLPDKGCLPLRLGSL